jgi:exodeoxyribonuclease V alpha subunit
MSVELEGILETITYRNEQTGCSVARLQVSGLPGQVTVVGTLHDPVVGQTLQLSGEWQEHPRYGRQFRIQASRSVSPATSEGVERYLGSGLVRGVGPELARRIVTRGRRLVVLAGTRRALHIASSKARAGGRFTGLTRRLQATE